MTAGTQNQIQAVIDANIFPTVIQMLKTPVISIKLETTWAVSNAEMSSFWSMIGTFQSYSDY